MDTIHIKTHQREVLQDITSRVQAYLDERGCTRGVLTLYSPHTTCAVTINEGCDPDVARDMIQTLRRLVPHVKTSLVGPAQQVLVEDGQVCLGTWQRIFLAEFDGPRTRKLWAMWMGD